MRRKIKLSALAPLVALGLPLWFAGPAKADLITFNLDTFNTAGFAAPYVKVDVARSDSTNATVTFTSLASGGDIFLMGAVNAVALNVNATSWTLGSVTGTNAGTGFTPGGYTNEGSGNVDGWGIFNQTIKSFDGFTHSADKIIVALTDISGTWANDSDVLTSNGSGGYLAAAHLFVTTNPANKANGAIVTGFATGSGTANRCLNGATNFPICTNFEIPEPSSMLIFSGGLLGLATVLRRRRGA